MRLDSLFNSFDPVSRDSDFLELEKIALKEFEAYRAATGAPSDGNVIVKRKGKPGNRREIWLVSEMDTLVAAGRPAVEAAVMELGYRELFARMLSWYKDVDFPFLHDISEGRDSDFQTAWKECMRHVNDMPSWEKMSAEIIRERFSVFCYIWICLAVDPAKPRDRQVEFSRGYSAASSFLLDSEENGAKMGSFANWLRTWLKQPST